MIDISKKNEVYLISINPQTDEERELINKIYKVREGTKTRQEEKNYWTLDEPESVQMTINDIDEEWSLNASNEFKPISKAIEKECPFTNE